MTTEFLKVGVVGCGYVAQVGHIPALLKCRNVNLVAICDRDEDLARKVAGKFKIGKCYANFKEMLDSEKLDVVDICTSINTHASLAIQAMEAGCHVFTEKPLAMNTREADEMIEVSNRNRVSLSVMQNILFSPTITKMRYLINKGVIGDLIRVEIIQSTPPQDYPPIADPTHWYHKLPGGIFFDNLPHPIYLMRAFLGNIEPIAVQVSKMGGWQHLPIDEVQILFKGGQGVGTIISSCNYPSLWSVNVFGTKMNLHGNIINSYVITYGGKSKAGRPIATLYARENLNRSFQILHSTLSIGIKMLQGKHRGTPIAISRFMESIQNGTKPPVSAEDGREVLRILEKIIGQM